MALTLVNIRGLKEMSATQIAMTVLKIVPLIAIVGLALAIGQPSNLPAFNPSGAPVIAFACSRGAHHALAVHRL